MKPAFYNHSLIVAMLKDGPKTRAEIAEALGIEIGLAKKIVGWLQAHGLVDAPAGLRGRPAAVSVTEEGRDFDFKALMSGQRSAAQRIGQAPRRKQCGVVASAMRTSPSFVFDLGAF